FLRAPLDLGVAALHRIEIEILLVGAGVHARSRAAAQPDQHSRAAELYQQRTLGYFRFRGVDRRDVAHAACDHDRLVIAAHLVADALLESAEVAGEIGPAELVVERRASDRPFDHDLQR